MKNDMGKVVIAGLAALAMVTGVCRAEEAATEVSVSADLVSAYVFRGVTFNDGAALQPGLEVGGLPITFGVWGNLDIDDYSGMLDDGQFSELDLYASYDLPELMEGLGLSIGYCEYTYPSGGGAADRELSVSAGLDLPLAPGIGLYYGVDGGIEESLYVELTVEQEIPLSEEVGLALSGALGYLSPETGDDGFTHFSVTADVAWSFLSAGVTYVGQIDDDVLADYVPAGMDTDASLGYDVEVIGRVGVSGSF